MKTVEELVKTYRIEKADNGLLKVLNTSQAKKDRIVEELKARKQEIVDYLNALEAKYEDRKRRIAKIEGLEEIRQAERELSEWHYKLEKSFDGEYAVGGMGVEQKPQHDIAALKAKYPRATAYLRAEAQSEKHNYELASIGVRALETVIYGDYQKAMQTMEAEIDAFVNKHQWD